MTAADDGPVHHFTYSRGIAPMLWVFVALASIELLVVHFLIALWRHDVAIALSIVTLASIIWFVHAILSFARLPVLVGRDAVTLRVGTIRTMTVPIVEIAGVRSDWTSGALKTPGVVNLALIAHPNVIVDLHLPQTSRGRTIRSIAHRLDDPGAFAQAVQALGCGA